MRKIAIFLAVSSIACILLTPSPSCAEYNPATGRFLQRDPIGTKPRVVFFKKGPRFLGTYGPVAPNPSKSLLSDRKPSQQIEIFKLNQYSDGMNIYEYVRSDPIILTDPFGLFYYYLKYPCFQGVSGTCIDLVECPFFGLLGKCYVAESYFVPNAGDNWPTPKYIGDDWKDPYYFWDIDQQRQIDTPRSAPGCHWKSCRKAKEFKFLLDSVLNAYRSLGVTITDRKLRKCIWGRLRNAVIVCSNKGGKGAGANIRGRRSIYIYPKRYTNGIYGGGKLTAGELVIHEFAHTCGWVHGEGKGVPGNFGIAELE